MDKREILIRQAELKDLDDIYRLYDKYMYDSHLAKMGPSFVKGYLEAIITSAECVTFIAEEDSAVGFIMGSYDHRAIKFRLLRDAKILSEWFRKLLRRPSLAFETLALMTYPMLSYIKGIRAELLFISIVPEYRNRNIATMLIDATLDSMRNKKIDAVKVSTVATNDVVNRLLAKLGFRRRRAFRIFGKEMILYTHKLR
jgi:ribosomal protein S18 acetylase RimI-like enzyme